MGTKIDDHFVVVRRETLADLCALIAEVDDRGYLEEVPEPFVDGIRGAIAELRCVAAVPA